MRGKVVNKKTFQVIDDVDLDRYPESQWLLNPSFNRVVGYEKKFWRIIDNPMYGEPQDGTSTETSGGTSGSLIVPKEILDLKPENEILLIKGLDTFRVYDYMIDPPRDRNQEPNDINYDILGLYKEKTFIKGELVRVDYWGGYDMMTQQYSDLIVREDRVYWRSNGMIYFRWMRINWYRQSGEIGNTKFTKKYFQPDESYIEGDRRRENVITALKINTVGLIAQTEGLTIFDAERLGMPFLTSANPSIVLFIQGVEQPLNDFFLNASSVDYPFLENFIAPGVTIRLFLVDFIQFDYFEYDISDYTGEFYTRLIPSGSE